MSSRDRVDRPARRQNRALGGPEWHLFLGSFFIYFFAWTGGEASSTWCWSGLFIDAFFFCYPLLTHVFGWKIVTSWSELFGFGTGEPVAPKKKGSTAEAEQAGTGEDMTEVVPFAQP